MPPMRLRTRRTERPRVGGQRLILRLADGPTGADDTPMSTSNPSSHPANATKERGLRTHLALIGAAVGVVLVVIWMIRNSRSVRVDWLFGSTNAPLWLVIIIAAVLGWLVGTATTALVRRRRGAHE